MRTLPMTSHVCLGESSACPVRDLEMDLQDNSHAIPSLHRWTMLVLLVMLGVDF